MFVGALGETIPAHTPHAVSVSLPTWKANVAYEEGEDWVINALATGYPRFFVNKLIVAFAEDIVSRHGRLGEQAMLFPSNKTARRCVDFMFAKDDAPNKVRQRIVSLVIDQSKVTSRTLQSLNPSISAVIYSKDKWPLAKQYWQHSGDGVSSRRAEFCHGLFQEGLLVEETTLAGTANGHRLHKGPRRYQRGGSVDQTIGGNHSNTSATSPEANNEVKESSLFVEERFGRNLDMSLVKNAKSAVRRRIAGSLLGEVDLMAAPSPSMPQSTRGVATLSEDDVYLYPCGMNAIFNAHQLMLEARGPMKSIVFGFPYVDTLKILEKFGPGCIFYGNGDSNDLDDLERRLTEGERYLALFCEFPGNPLLKSPDLQRIKKLANKFNFGIVVDETIGNFINIHVLPYADIIVSSLTKIFTGECNVMGGSGILNPEGQYYRRLKEISSYQHEDNYWAEDVLYMERNSRDFVSRIERINTNAEVICEVLQKHSSVKKVYYPKYIESRQNYDACRTPNGGYGGLLSVTFHQKAQAVAFFDAIDTAKGPSLGTNFTMTSPYAILAHYGELDWAAQFGVEADLVRISVGLEETEMLRKIFLAGLEAAAATNGS